MKPRPMGSADDLDDDWWMGAETESDPPSEKKKKKKNKAAKDEPQESAQECTQESDSVTSPKKRKHERGETEEQDSEDLPATTGQSKKSKKSGNACSAEEKSKSSSSSSSSLTVSKGVISRRPIMTHAEVAEEVRTRLSSSGRAAVDEEDLVFSEEHALVPTLSGSDDLTFSRYLDTAVSDWSKSLAKLKVTKHGRPVMLVICSSAVRSVDLIRAAGQFSSGSQVAKLFAKHFKLEHHHEFLAKTVVHIGVGTPNRILKLVESGHLSLKRLKYVVFDWTMQDTKQRQIFEIPEVVQDLVRLTLSAILPRVQEGKTKIGLF